MRVVNSRQGMIDMLVEFVGIKSGLMLSQEDLIELLDLNFDAVDEVAIILGGKTRWWDGDKEDLVLVRGEELEANFILVMHAIGAIPDRRTASDILDGFVLDNSARLGIDKDDVDAFMAAVSELMMPLAKGETPRGTEPIAEEFRRRYLLDWNFPTQREWDGMIPLRNLFESEDIPENTTPDRYFDQRFIDFLKAQPQELHRIHWRQFEYLVAEYYLRQGYRVEITPPRGDGGVDVKATREGGVIGPDLIVIQCRRYADSNTIGIEAVRAFWTTVTEEGATRGLIVTTSRLERGARTFCQARKYRLSALEGDNVLGWLHRLATRRPEA